MTATSRISQLAKTNAYYSTNHHCGSQYGATAQGFSLLFLRFLCPISSPSLSLAPNAKQDKKTHIQKDKNTPLENSSSHYEQAKQSMHVVLSFLF